MRPSTGSSPSPLFVDTWGWLVLEDRRHPAHLPVVQLRRQHSDSGGLLVTTDYVLDEMVTRLFARRPFTEAEAFCSQVFQAGKVGLLRIEPITPERFEKAYGLRLRYRDKPRISFTDLTSFAVMRELGVRRALTGDAHFRQVHLGFQTLP